ncbi:MAG: ZIP family metal transporter [Candidatus Sericytochromatia bacterium]|nr:ZIP family metal transporter [Candidatus Tanganyikabacteria bacterium]
MIAALATAFTIAGGSLPLSKRELPHRHLSWLVAFSAGIILSAGLLSMLREAGELLPGGQSLVWAGAGFLALYLLERITIIHSCHDEECEREAGSLVHEGDHPRATQAGVALWGIGFHGMIDGFALAVSTESHNVALTLIVAVGVLLHSFPTGMSLAALMLYGGIERRAAWRILVAIASMAIVGAGIGLQIQNPALASLVGGGVFAPESGLLGAALAFSAGNFIYIATGDLLPEAHRNRSDYGVPFSVVAGFAVNYVAFLLVAH